MVNVGIIGLGSVWEHRYFPALKRLQGRMRVRAVYDPVTNRADQVAAELRADVVEGMVALVERTDVQAVLWLDAAWHGLVPLHILHAKRKPVYISGSLGENFELLRCLHQLAISDGLTFMPEFSRRYTPASGRLQELMATRIGSPKELRIEAVAPAPGQSPVIPGQGPGMDFLIGLLDWCRYIVRTAPVSIEAESLNESANGAVTGRRIVIEHAKRRSGGECPRAELVLRIPHAPVAPEGQEPQPPRVDCRVLCERGEARTEAPAELWWNNGTETTTEVLTSDRSEVEVMLDLFFRRAVGGLLPVPDLNDICRCITLVRTIEQSLHEGRPIGLNDEM